MRLLIIPAIDLMGGECVRLTRGIASTKKVYAKNPIEIVSRFEDDGATLIHLVDLDATLGLGDNVSTIREVLEKADAAIQVAGGIRSFEKAKLLIGSGAYRIVVGTAAIKNQSLIKDAVTAFGGSKIAVAVDVDQGQVMIKGWKERSEIALERVLDSFSRLRLGTLIFTSVNADGMMEGPAIDVIRSLRREWSASLIVGGGIRCMEDLRKLQDFKVDGAIIGKALYEGQLDLRKAIEEFENRRTQ